MMRTLLSACSLFLALASCQRTPYAVLPTSPSPYYQAVPRSPDVAARPLHQPALPPGPGTEPVAGTHRPIASTAAARPSPARGRAASSVPSSPAPASPVRRMPAVSTPGPQASYHRVTPDPPEKIKRNPKKRLFWRLFWPGLLLVIAAVVIVGLSTAAPTAAGGTVALNMLKDFLVVLPFYTAFVGALSLIIRLIWPHDPTREG